MGLLAFVYRTPDGVDCTNNGLSHQYDRMTIVNVDGPFEPSETAPACWLVKGNNQGTVRIVVEDPHMAKRRHFMMGGNYLSTSDSRLSQAVEEITGEMWYGAIAIHDRHEG